MATAPTTTDVTNMPAPDGKELYVNNDREKDDIPNLHTKQMNFFFHPKYRTLISILHM